MSIADVIAFAVTKQATDIHVQEGCPVMLRIGMELIPCKNWFVTKEEIRYWLLARGWSDGEDEALSARWMKRSGSAYNFVRHMAGFMPTSAFYILCHRCQRMRMSRYCSGWRVVLMA